MRYKSDRFSRVIAGTAHWIAISRIKVVFSCCFFLSNTCFDHLDVFLFSMGKHCIRKCSKWTRYADNFRVRNDGFYENGQMCSSDFAFMKSHVLHRLQPGRPEAFYSCQLFKVIWWLIPLLENPPPPPHPPQDGPVWCSCSELLAQQLSRVSMGRLCCLQPISQNSAWRCCHHVWNPLLGTSSVIFTFPQRLTNVFLFNPKTSCQSFNVHHLCSRQFFPFVGQSEIWLFFIVILQWSPASWTHCWLWKGHHCFTVAILCSCQLVINYKLSDLFLLALLCIWG